LLDLRRFRWIRLASGNDADDVLFLKVVVATNQDIQFDADTEEKIALLQVGVLRVRYCPRIVVDKGSLASSKETPRFS
jgi:hypothetical protein